MPANPSLPAATPTGAGSAALRPDGRRVAIHTLDVRGRFIRARRVTFAILIAIYVAAPLVRIGGYPAIHLDVAARRFHLLGSTFNAQDFWIVFFLCTATLFTLLFLTAWRGRMWCGWGCPQTVFLEAIYRPIERLIEGPRSQRLKLAGAPWTARRVARSALKHALYLVISLALSHVALSLFLSAAELAAMVREGPARHPAAFTWSVAVTGALYFNFAWFREQLCIVICPYGRLQSVLHDRDSIVIGYDARRGEPRGKLARAAAGAGERTSGDCIDCKKCVYACPTGIDIRNGLQMECLACAQCVDACDEVMLKIKRPPGLVRHDSLNRLAGLSSRVLRPRLAVYAAVAFLAVSGAVAALALRKPFEAIVIRQPGVPWVVEAGRVRNQLEIHLTNKRGTPARFQLGVHSPLDEAAVSIGLGQSSVELPPLGDVRIPLVITVDQRALRPGLGFELTTGDDAGTTRRQEIRFIAPWGAGSKLQK